MSNDTPNRWPKQPTYPIGRTSHVWFGRGYQAAMIDIRERLDDGGINAVVEWIENNTQWSYAYPARKLTESPS